MWLQMLKKAHFCMHFPPFSLPSNICIIQLYTYVYVRYDIHVNNCQSAALTDCFNCSFCAWASGVSDTFHIPSDNIMVIAKVQELFL